MMSRFLHQRMRTTLTLDGDVAAKLKTEAQTQRRVDCEPDFFAFAAVFSAAWRPAGLAE
jgi:hypothetical protein